MLDISLLIIGGLCPLILGYLGFHVSAWPPKEAQRPYFAGAFIVVGLLGFVAIIWSGIRSGTAQNEIQSGINSLLNAHESNLNRLSNDQLRERAMATAAEIRAFASGAQDQFQAIFDKYPNAHSLKSPDREQELKLDQEFMPLANKVQTELDKKMHQDAIALREAMEKKLGHFPPYAPQMETTFFETPGTPNTTVMFMGAAYLDKLARQLPP